MNKPITTLAALLVVGTAALTGCGSSSSKEAGASSLASTAPTASLVDTTPVTLTVFQQLTAITDDEFNAFLAEPVKKKFPNVTMQLVRYNPKVPIETMIQSDSFPDLIYADSLDIHRYNLFNLLEPLDPYIKKSAFDLSKYVPEAIQQIKAYSDKGEMYSLPLYINFSALFYNKDLFDKFAVSYPKDNMTWNDMIALAKKLARTDNGVKYMGLRMQSPARVGTTFGLAFSDPKTGYAVLQTDAWKNWLNLYKDAYTAGQADRFAAEADFFKNGNIAMLATYSSQVGTFEDLYEAGKPMNWDMVTMPYIPSSPNPVESVPGLMLTTTGHHKDIAFKVMEELAGRDSELNLARYGKRPVLNDPSLNDQFAANMGAYKGKNVKGILSHKLAVGPKPGLYDDTIRPLVNSEMMDEVIKKGIDVNTALKTAEEKANKAIAQKAQK